MELFFNYATPILYWTLIVIWGAIFVFYIIKIKQLKEYGKLLKLLLVILAIDAFRTFFESVYFGAWYTSYSGLLPISIFNFLAHPKVVFIPKIFNLIAACLVLFLIIKKWLVYEIVEVNKIKGIINIQGFEIKKLKAAVEQSANSIVITNVTGDIEYVNPKFTEVSGYTFKEVLGQNPRVLNSGKQDRAFYKEMWDIISRGNEWSGELINKHKNGSVFWEYATISPIKNDNGEIVNYLAIKEDISEKRKSEELLSEQKNLFEVMFNTITDGIIITDKERKILLANKGVQNTFGYSPNELLGKKTEVFYAENKDYEAKGSVIFSDNAPVKSNLYVTQYKGKDGQVFPGETFGTKLLNTRGEWIGNLGIIRDVSERINFINDISDAKEQAEHSSLLKTEFLNNMSHEIRTPLNGILGFSEMLYNPDLSIEKRNNFLKIINNCGQQLLHIIDDILEISSLETHQVKVILEEVCLNDLMFEVFSIFDIKAKENKIPIYFNKGLTDRQSIIRIDSLKLNKIISNLVENALKYTNNGFIEFGYTLQNQEIEIYVKDTGIGIDKVYHQTIFDRFAQVEKDIAMKTGGLGLGLSIVKENVELLGGKISLNSSLESGTTFYVSIPYEPVYNDDLNMKLENSDTILITEDEEVNYLYLVALLEQILKVNYNIIHAKNGKEAIEFCKTNPQIDLVFMDIKMPILNGYEATKEIKRLLPKLPIIAITAYSAIKEKDMAKSVGCDDFVSKPIDREHLESVVEKYFTTKTRSK